MDECTKKDCFMKGEIVKKVILDMDYTVAQVAEMIGTSQQNLASALKHEDVRSGLLEKIAEALGLQLSTFYGASFGELPNVSGPSDMSGVLELLKIKDEQLLVSMKQTSKAQEQMDRVLDVLTSQTPRPSVSVPVATVSLDQGGVVLPRSGKRKPLTSSLRAAKLASKTATVSLPLSGSKKDL